MNRIIVGLTGAFGSGTSFLATEFFEKSNFLKCSLSDILRSESEKKYGKKAETRNDLQEYGNELRKNDPSKLAKLVDKIILENKEYNIVIESIRNPAEIGFFRNKYPEFILIGVFADYDVRWKRVKSNYSDSKDKFDADERKDKGVLEPTYGQRISDCFFESDLIILNNEDFLCNDDNEEYSNMKLKIDAYLKALKDPTNSNPTLKETLMAAA